MPLKRQQAEHGEGAPVTGLFRECRILIDSASARRESGKVPASAAQILTGGERDMAMREIVPKQQVVSETSEAQIAVHWREEEYYYPSSKFIGQANLADPDVLNWFSEDKFPECFREYADMLSWDQYWHTTLDASDPPFWKWFV